MTDLGERNVEMRVLTTAADADHGWELRAEIRERRLAWSRAEHPEAIPRTRVAFPEAEAQTASAFDRMTSEIAA